MDSDLKIKIKIDSDTGELIVARKEFDKLGRTVNGATKNTSNFSSSIKTLAGVAGSLYLVKQGFDVIYASAKQFVSIADNMSMVNSRLSLVTESTEEYIRAQKELLYISNTARVGMQGTVDLYTQLDRSTSSLGITQNELLRVTDTISKTLTISGASAASADAALIQLSQGFASGTLRGEELNSVMEQTPRLAQAIANGMGVSIGQLRAMGTEGQLTAQSVMEALKSQANVVNAEFVGIAINASSGYTVLQNNISSTMAKMDEHFLITQTVGSAYVALGKGSDVFANSIIGGFEDSSSAAGAFANFTIESINGIIKAFGLLYDMGNTVGLAIDAIQVGIYGLLSPIQVMANTLNSFLNGILASVDAIGKFAGMGGINYRISYTDFATEGVKRNFKEALENWEQIGTGGKTAEKVTLAVSEAFSGLIRARSEDHSVEWGTYKPDTTIVNNNPIDYETKSVTDALLEYGDTFSNADLQDILKTYSGNNGIAEAIAEMISNREYNNSLENLTQQIQKDQAQVNFNSTIEDTNNSIDQTTTAIDTLKDTLYTGNNTEDTVSIVHNAIGSFNDLNKSVNNIDYTVNNAVKSVDRFIFAFSNTLTNSISSNISSLNSVASQNAFTTVSYADALQKAREAQERLKSNPLDKNIGKEYTAAYNQFVTSATDYLANSSNFTSSVQKDFEKSLIANQAAQFESTAVKSVDVLESMNNYLGSINQAYADGILTDQEKATIAGVATDVNAKNELLLVGSNSVSTFIKKLMGNNNEGISLTSIASALPALSVATNLDENDLSNIDASTKATIEAINNLGDAIHSLPSATSGGSTSSGSAIAVGTTQNFQVPVYATKVVGRGYDAFGNYNPGTTITDYSIIERYETVTKKWDGDSWESFAKGGFTGEGFGAADKSGFKIAGLVHEDEWVGAKWMIEQRPDIFAQLEKVRQRGSFASGGYTSSKNSISFSSSNTDDKLLKVIEELKDEIVEIKDTNKNLLGKIEKNTKEPRFVA
jgi:tape measure domain-containing protein